MDRQCSLAVCSAVLSLTVMVVVIRSPPSDLSLVITVVGHLGPSTTGREMGLGFTVGGADAV